MRSFAQKLFAVLLTIAFYYSSPAQPAHTGQLFIPDKTIIIPFIWKGDSINGRWEQYAAMLIPVKLEHCPRRFYMQFDLGSPYSLFYTNKLKGLADKYPRSIDITDTATRLNLNFRLGKTSIIAQGITIRKLGTDGLGLKNNAPEIIGTLGVDLIDDRQVLIDYPGKKIYLNFHSADSATTTSLYYTNGRVLLPADIRGKQTILYFDTGSSAFELLASKETAISLAAPSATPLTYRVNSWGKMLEATTIPSNDSIGISGQKLPLHSVTYVEGASDSQVKQMMKMGIGGMTGNKLFLRSLLFLDLRNKKFFIKEKGK